MASSPRQRSRSTRVVRLVATVGITVGVIGLAPTRSDAVPGDSPNTCTAARTQFTTISRQAETTSEDYNDAKLARAKAEKALTVAKKNARVVEVQFQGLQAQFKRIVASEMKSAPASEAATVFSGSGPREFLDQMSLIDYVAGKKQEKIKAVVAVRQKVLKAQSAVQTQVTARKKAETAMRTKYTELKKRASTLKALSSRLCATPDVTDPSRTAAQSQEAVSGSVALGGSPSAAARTAVQFALNQRGAPYVWGAEGPVSAGYDCSGLTLKAWAAAGVSLPHSSKTQSTMGTPVPRSQVQAGDLVFFYDPVSHVGIAINNTQMVDASTYGVPVTIHNIDGGSPYAGARRFG